MDTIFEYFRFALYEDKQRSFFKTKSNIDHFTDIFSEEATHYFESGQVSYGLKVKRISDGFIFCKIGKKSRIKRKLSPDEDFKEIYDENWENVYLVFNCDTNKDSEFVQTVAMQSKAAIFRSNYNVLEALRKYINSKLHETSLSIDFNTIDPRDSGRSRFWRIIEENKDKIKSITFEHAPPNMFKRNDQLDEDLREARELFNANKIVTKLENTETALTIPEENNFIEQSLDVVDRGEGRYKVKANGRTFSSSEETLKKTLSLNIDNLSKEELINFLKLLFA